MFGGSEGRGRVLTGTPTKNIANVSSHHTISRTFHQLAPFFRPGVFSTGTSRPTRSCVVPQTSAGEPTPPGLVRGATVATARLTAQPWRDRNGERRFPNNQTQGLRTGKQCDVLWRLFAHHQRFWFARCPSKRSRTPPRSVVSAPSQPQATLAQSYAVGPHR